MISAVEHLDGGHDAFAFFPAQFHRTKDRKVKRRPDNDHY
jgi:hypothetical protein